MPGFGFKTEVVTCTTAGTRYNPTTKYLPAGTLVQPVAGNSGSVYMGGSDVTSTNGWVLSTSAPTRLGDVRLSGSHEDFFGPAVYFVSAQNGDKVVLLIPIRDNSAV